MDRWKSPYFEHKSSMSGIWTVFSVHISDIKSWCLEYGQWKPVLFQTSLIFSVYIPDITVYIPDIIAHILDITVLIADINFMKNSMSGIWPVKTGLIPDIKSRCPKYQPGPISRHSPTLGYLIPTIMSCVIGVIFLAQDIFLAKWTHPFEWSTF